MSQTAAALIPQVFVLWHPQYVHGETMARRILQWLRPGNGLGPEVFYRCLPAPDAPRNGLPPALTLERRAGANAATDPRNTHRLQIVVPLIDEHMVADRTWRYWLEHIAAQPKTHLMPVAVDATAYNMPPKLKELNYLRPSGIPLTSHDQSSPAFAALVASLLKQLTEAMCRLILPRPARSASGAASSAPLPKVNVFLSHAKQDGTVPARRLRDYIYSQTQLAAFYDENDIAFGDIFSRVLEGALQSDDTAGLIVVRSARYASRPWCRRELAQFRRPRRVTLADDDGTKPEYWRLFPTLIVEAMEGRDMTLGIPEFGNSPVIRWEDEDQGLEELIVTTVIRDAMLASFHAALGHSIDATSNDIVINWLPDPTTLMQVDAIRAGKARTVLYPGRGLSGLELDILDKYFPALVFKPFEEVLETSP
jgi:hypothetical protein